MGEGVHGLCLLTGLKVMDLCVFVVFVFSNYFGCLRGRRRFCAGVWGMEGFNRRYTELGSRLRLN